MVMTVILLVIGSFTAVGVVLTERVDRPLRRIARSGVQPDAPMRR